MTEETLLQQGVAHHQAGRFHDAERCYRQVLSNNPQSAEAWHLLGVIAHEANHPRDAIDYIRRALALAGAKPAYLNHLGIVYKTLDELELARSQFLAALKLEPSYAPAINNLADVYKDLGDIREAVTLYRRAVDAEPDSPVIFSNYLYTLQFDPDTDRVALAAEHCRYGARFGAPAGRRDRHANDPDPERPLRLGIVSPCFGRYPPMTFFLPVLQNLDRSRFQIFLYSNLLHPDPLTQRTQSLADRWVSVVSLTAEEAARQIEKDRIDILVDLSGHMARNRLDIFALKPAPIQVTQLDYPHSTGLPAMDYRLTDAVVEPPEWPVLGPEQLWRLPDCFVCFGPPAAAPPLTPLPAAARGHVTFAAPHQIFKLNDGVLAAYAVVLRALPTARLAFIRSSLTAAQIDRLRQRLDRAGAPLDRLDFVRPGHHEDYLKCAADVDIMLDAWPYNGQTTTCEYLWMGIPVVTLLGDRPAGRVSGSILERLGLGDLVAKTTGDFVAIAGKLASDIALLGDLRAGLRELVSVTVADGPAYTRQLEEAYRDMWRSWCRTQSESTTLVAPGRRDPMAVEPAAPTLPAPESLNDQAVVLARMGRLAEAETLLRRDLTLRPHQASIYGNLAHLLGLRGQLDEAEWGYTQAIRLDPTNADWHRRLGLLLLQRGRLMEAAVSLCHADRFRPDDAETLAALGQVQKALGHRDAAIATLRRALIAAGDNADRLNDLAVQLNQLGQVDEAHACFERILALDPHHASALCNRGFFLGEEGRTEEARTYYRRAIQSRPAPLLRLVEGTLLPVIYESLDHLDASRARLEENLRRLEADKVRVDPTQQQMPTLFYLAYQGQNDRSFAEALARLTVQPRPFQEPRRRTASHGRLRIGFLSHHLNNHTIGLLNHGLIAALDRTQFEVIVLAVGQCGDSMEQKMRQSAERFLVLPTELAPALQAVSDLNLDILYYPDLGMDPFTWTMAYSRLAPVQCVTWGHPVTTGMPTIDYFLSSADLETENSQEQYSEQLVRLSRLGVVYQRPDPLEPADRAAFGLPPGAHLYGCPQSLFKIHPEFDTILGDILRHDSAGRVVLLEGRSPSWTDLLRRRLQRTIPDVTKRIVFVPRQSRPGFLRLTACCDVLLDPIHFGGGNTTYEALALGVPVVTLPTPFLRCRLTYAQYRQMDMMDLVATNADDYVRLAVRLGTDPEWRAEINRRLQEKCHVLYDDVAIVRELEEFFHTAASRATDQS